jgi:hypothetical protein
MHLQGAGHSGEIREFFEHGWQAMGLDHLRSKVESLLAVREAETSVAEARKTNRWSALLTLAFGMITVPTLATEVIKHLWDYGGFWQPGDQNLAHLFRFGIAFVLVGSLWARPGCSWADTKRAEISTSLIWHVVPFRRAFDSGGSRRHRLGNATEPRIPLPEGRLPIPIQDPRADLQQ